MATVRWENQCQTPTSHFVRVWPGTLGREHDAVLDVVQSGHVHCLELAHVTGVEAGTLGHQNSA